MEMFVDSDYSYLSNEVKYKQDWKKNIYLYSISCIFCMIWCTTILSPQWEYW